MVRIVICDDQEVVREGLKKILGSDPDIEVVGTATNGSEVIELVEIHKPDLVLMDLKMPEMNGIQATHIVREKYPEIYVLILTTYDDDEWLFDAIRSGASGYLLKDTPRNELLNAIKGTIDGQTHVDPAVAGKLFARIAQNIPNKQQMGPDILSEREMEIIKLLARGFSNADIAKQLYLSEGTVRNYTSSIFAKLEVSDRTQAAVIALRYGWVDSEDT